MFNGYEFRNWLKRKENKTVGFARQSTCCPLAIFVVEGVGLSRPRVNPERLLVHPDCEFELPGWANRFVTLLDSSYEEEVLGSDALLILDQVESEGFDLSHEPELVDM